VIASPCVLMALGPTPHEYVDASVNSCAPCDKPKTQKIAAGSPDRLRQTKCKLGNANARHTVDLCWSVDLVRVATKNLRQAAINRAIAASLEKIYQLSSQLERRIAVKHVAGLTTDKMQQHRKLLLLLKLALCALLGDLLRCLGMEGESRAQPHPPPCRRPRCPYPRREPQCLPPSHPP